MEFNDFAGYVFILKGDSVVVGKGIEIPVLNDAFLNVFNELFFLFHLGNLAQFVENCAKIRKFFEILIMNYSINK